MTSKYISYLLIVAAVSLCATVCAAQPANKKADKKQTRKPKVAATLTKVAAASSTKAHAKSARNSSPTSATTSTTASASAMKRALASAGAPTTSTAMKNDPNHAVEIRGQSRTLSMMLVLKNSKESINFIKIRKDYTPEIAGTQF